MATAQSCAGPQAAVETAASDTDRLGAWWRGAVIYQIYPRSFRDTNGDGIGDLAKARTASPALRRGLSEVRAFSETTPGLLAIERHDPETGQRVLAVFNTSETPLSHSIEVSYRAVSVAPLLGQCPAALAAPGTLTIDLPAFGFAACILETDD